MVDVITRAEPLENKPPDPFRGPQLRGVARVLRTRSEQFQERSTLASSQLRGTARSRLAAQGYLSLFSRPLQPLADGSTADAELACDIRLGKALVVQVEGLKASVFKGGGVSALSHGARLSCATERVK